MRDFEQIDIQKAREMMDSSKEVTIVDIRDADSYAQGHIRNSILMTDESINRFLESAEKHKPIICYCYHGINSQMAAQYFKDNGFNKVFSMIGGFEVWRSVYPDEVVSE